MDRKAADFTFKVSKFQMTLGIELFRFFNEFVTPRFKVTDCTVHRIHSITNMSMRAAAVSFITSTVSPAKKLLDVARTSH